MSRHPLLDKASRTDTFESRRPVLTMIRFLKSLVPLSWRRQYWSYCLQRERFEATAISLGYPIARQLFNSTFSLNQRESVRLPGYNHPLCFRPRTSDVHVIYQVFVEQEYRPVANLSDVRLIFDCGANIGCTAFYLLQAYPRASMIVVEPDGANMALCRQNLQPFSSRVTFVEAGVWPEPVPLKVIRGEFRDGGSWSFQVRPCLEREHEDFLGITMTQLLSLSGCDEIDLLKIDIEGTERDVFAAKEMHWLERTRNIAVELHDDECKEVFEAAIRDYHCDRVRSGELNVCLGLNKAASSLEYQST